MQALGCAHGQKLINGEWFLAEINHYIITYFHSKRSCIFLWEIFVFKEKRLKSMSIAGLFLKTLRAYMNQNI